MGRRRKIRRQACSVEITPADLLRFRWKTANGDERRFAEATALGDTHENRKRVKQQAEIIGAEIRAGTFDYLKWFPNGNRAAEYLAAGGAPPPRTKAARADAWTIGDYYSEWIERRSAPVVRASAERDYRSHFRNYILTQLGEVELQDLSLAHLEDPRGTMRKRGLSEKTIRNTIDGSLRAMVRDAEQEEIAVSFPFGKVPWTDKIVPGPSPFSEAERDQILNYFRGKRWKSGGFNDTRPHYPYFAFLYTLFFTGMRPSNWSRCGSAALTSARERYRLNGHVILDPKPRPRPLGREGPSV